MFCCYFSFSLFSNVKISLILLLPLSSLSDFIISFSFLFSLYFIFIIIIVIIILFIYLFIYLFFVLFCFLLFFLFFFLIKQFLFSHQTVKVSRLFYLLFLQLKLYGNNPQLHYFSPVPKRFSIFFIYFHFNILLHFILNFALFFYQ